jgi:enoyl-[acyl-carrier protein] reductase III
MNLPRGAEGDSVFRPGVGGSAAGASSLQGASVLVTGGTRGIGRAIALRLVSDGAARAVLGYMRNDRAADEAAAVVEEAGAQPVLVRGNVADPRTVEEMASLGPYRVVVHNAATGVVRPALETEDKHWDWTMSANARALLSLARATAPAMDKGASILAISSLGSQRVLPNYVLIGTSKAALESVVRYLGFDLAPRGIRVNCVSAGVVDTEALDWFPNKEAMLASVKRTPAGRLVEPEDVAAVVSFLCSPDAAMICGQTLVVDGGYSLGA